MSKTYKIAMRNIINVLSRVKNSKEKLVEKTISTLLILNQ